MTEEEEGFCVHVWIEDQPCHDVTQCLMHLPDYLQARGALQNLQRHNHESQECNMRAMICYLYSEIMGKARVIPPSSRAALSPQLSIWTASHAHSSAPTSLPFSPASSQPPASSPIATRTLQSSWVNQCSISAWAFTWLKKTASLKRQLLHMDRPWKHFGDISFMHKRSNHRAALQDFGAPEETRAGREKGHGELIVGCFLSSRGRKLPRMPFPALDINSKVSFYELGAYCFPKEKWEAKAGLYR